MASADTQEPAETSALPDYVLDADAVLKDANIIWRYGKAPDYSRTRQMWVETKSQSHPAQSLPDLVEKLVKNWEIEASHKLDLADWRTIDGEANYTVSVNGGPPMSAQHMVNVGTYNALISPSEFYCPARASFDDSHKTFKSMMPTFAWEVLDVYSGPPKVAFKWRHWGEMKGDYVGVNDKGETVTIKAHGGRLEIQGVAAAEVNEKLQLQKVEIFFDPQALFRQMAPDGETGVSKVKAEA